MEDNTARDLIESNRAFITAIGMHWANEERKKRNEANAYSENDFFDLTGQF